MDRHWSDHLEGVRIGRGAKIGAGSVVATDIPLGAQVKGNPARWGNIQEK
jgi:acetyltransferase-like isoleucine patch superfamily enzyme